MSAGDLLQWISQAILEERLDPEAEVFFEGQPNVMYGLNVDRVEVDDDGDLAFYRTLPVTP